MDSPWGCVMYTSSENSGEIQELRLTSALDHAMNAAADNEAKNLKKNIGRSDIFFFSMCTLVGVDTIATIATQGAQAFSWLVLFGIFFFIPSAMVFAELGAAFPQEGGPYVWVRLAFGHLPAAINNFFYWVTNPVWLGGTLTLLAATTVEVFFLGGRPFSPIAFYGFALSFIWVGVASTILSFNVGRWIPIIGTYARFILLGFFAISTVIYALKNGVHGVHFENFKVSFSGLVALVGVILFNYVGFETPHAAGEEMKNPQKDIPIAIRRGASSALALYGIPILGILVVLPTKEVSGLAGFIDAIKVVFSVYGGEVGGGGTQLTGMGALLGNAMALLFILCLLSSGTAWIMGSDRALAVSGYDGAAPRWLGVISKKYGTPVRVNIFSGLISTATLIATRILSKGDHAKYFGAVLNIAVSTTLLSYIVIFPALWRLRITHPNQFRPYRSPMAPTLSVWLTLCIVFASVQLVAPGLGVDWFGADFAPKGWIKEERVTYLLVELVPLALFVVFGVLSWAMGGSTRRRAVL